MNKITLIVALSSVLLLSSFTDMAAESGRVEDIDNLEALPSACTKELYAAYQSGDAKKAAAVIKDCKKAEGKKRDQLGKALSYAGSKDDGETKERIHQAHRDAASWTETLFYPKNRKKLYTVVAAAGTVAVLVGVKLCERIISDEK